jgi:hypothetical protein
MKHLLCAAVLVLLPGLAAAQNPCTAALPPGVIISPTSEVVAALSTHTAVVNGIPVVTGYVLGVFLPGVNPATGGQPVSQVNLAKTAFTLKAGTVDCYGARPVELLAIPINQDTFLALKAVRTTPDTVESAWSTLSNPFARLGPPAVPTGTRVTP